MPEVILPGTYIEVRAEGLISAGRVATGNIGIVGTAAKGPVDEVTILGSLSEAREIFGDSDEWIDGTKDELTLIRALELIYRNGGQTVYAVRTANIKTDETKTDETETDETENAKLPDDDTSSLASGADEAKATAKDYERSLALLENEIVNIVLLAGQDATKEGMANIIQGHLNTTAGIKRERIGIIGSGFTDGKDDLDEIIKNIPSNDDGRLIYTAPGVTTNGKKNKLPGGYLAAAIAGLIASLPVQTSPTNKTLTIEGLTNEFNNSQLEKLVSSKILAVEKRNGFRLVKGITTADSPWNQITTRRIVDYAIYGVRSSCDPYIGKLNNERVRGAMKATLDAFLTRMVESEALVGYTLDVSATRRQEIEGQVMVTMTLMPTFSIDFIMVTLYLS